MFKIFLKYILGLLNLLINIYILSSFIFATIDWVLVLVLV